MCPIRLITRQYELKLPDLVCIVGLYHFFSTTLSFNSDLLLSFVGKLFFVLEFTVLDFDTAPPVDLEDDLAAAAVGLAVLGCLLDFRLRGFDDMTELVCCLLPPLSLEVAVGRARILTRRGGNNSSSLDDDARHVLDLL